MFRGLGFGFRVVAIEATMTLRCRAQGFVLRGLGLKALDLSTTGRS